MKRTDCFAEPRGPDTFERFASLVLGAAVLAAGAGVIIAGDVGHALDVFAVVALGALPMARVARLAVSWWRADDRRYAGAAGALLALMVVAVSVVSLWR
jgi:hypothetical protein